MKPEQRKKSSVDQQPYIKHPLNPYILWTQKRRKEIASANLNLRDSEISKQICAEWNKMTKEQQQPFIDEAKRLREQHIRDHPEFKHNYGSGNLYPYLLWSRYRKIEISDANPMLLYSEICKQMNKEWKLMRIEEKQPYIDYVERMREQRMGDNPEYKCCPQHNPKSGISSECAAIQSQEDSPSQHKCTYLESKVSKQELNPCDSVHNISCCTSSIQHSRPGPPYCNDESPLDLCIRKDDESPLDLSIRKVR